MKYFIFPLLTALVSHSAFAVDYTGQKLECSLYYKTQKQQYKGRSAKVRKRETGAKNSPFNPEIVVDLEKVATAMEPTKISKTTTSKHSFKGEVQIDLSFSPPDESGLIGLDISLYHLASLRGENVLAKENILAQTSEKHSLVPHIPTRSAPGIRTQLWSDQRNLFTFDVLCTVWAKDKS